MRESKWHAPAEAAPPKEASDPCHVETIEQWALGEERPFLLFSE